MMGIPQSMIDPFTVSMAKTVVAKHLRIVVTGNTAFLKWLLQRRACYG